MREQAAEAGQVVKCETFLKTGHFSFRLYVLWLSSCLFAIPHENTDVRLVLKDNLACSFLHRCSITKT
jgi:hypothetical protein